MVRVGLSHTGGVRRNDEAYIDGESIAVGRYFW